MDIVEAKKALETALLCTHEPLSVNTFMQPYAVHEGVEGDVDANMIKLMVEEMRIDWSNKGYRGCLSVAWLAFSKPS